MKTAYYIVHPARVERVLEGGMSSIDFEEPSLYDDLVLAGYPLNNDDALGGYYLDIAVRDDRVFVFTSNPAAEHDMGEAAGLFLGWRALNDHEPDEDEPGGTA
jgi:hypothetical protein